MSWIPADRVKRRERTKPIRLNRKRALRSWIIRGFALIGVLAVNLSLFSGSSNNPADFAGLR